MLLCIHHRYLAKAFTTTSSAIHFILHKILAIIPSSLQKVEWVPQLPFDKALTWDALHEVMKLIFNELGVSTIILQTIPIQNNVKDLDELVAVNRKI